MTRAAAERANARQGQVIIMAALFASALFGVLGLVTDLGVSFAGRRSMQNAADAAAYAGARVVAKAALTSGLSATSEVNAMIADNSFSLSTGAAVVESCSYVNDASAVVGACSSTVPSTATGVRVTVAETHPTFFIRVLPGAPETATTRATATAHVQRLASIPADGPFLVCGINTKLESGGSLSMMIEVNDVWQINPAAVGQTFKIHGPQIEKCKAKASRYKGVADQGANRPKSAPPETWFNYDEGTEAGPINQDVEGLMGCKAGQTIDNCVVFLPIVIDTPEESGNNRQLWTVGFAPFFVTATGANTHSGKLLGAYIVKGPTSAGWTPTNIGPIVIKLTA